MKPIRSKVLKPLFPNVGIEMAYRAALEKLIKEMHASVEYWVTAKFKNNSPEIAFDAAPIDNPFPQMSAWDVPEGFTGIVHGARGAASQGINTWGAYLNGEMLRDVRGVGRVFKSAQGASAALREFMSVPAEVLKLTINQLKDRWLKKFDDASEKLADYFTGDVSKRTDARMKRILKDGGISIPFTMTPAQKDIASATVHANVALIKSIPRQYLTNVEGAVMRSVQRGGDMGQLSKELQKEFGVTKLRAALISRDQNIKATSAFTRARQIELGITEAVWMHSHAGKEPRPTHVKMNGKRYNVTEGMYDPAEKRNISPGELINCRCTSKSVIAGFS